MTRYQKLLVVSGGLINRAHKTGLLAATFSQPRGGRCHGTYIFRSSKSGIDLIFYKKMNIYLLQSVLHIWRWSLFVASLLTDTIHPQSVFDSNSSAGCLLTQITEISQILKTQIHADHARFWSWSCEVVCIFFYFSVLSANDFFFIHF